MVLVTLRETASVAVTRIQTRARQVMATRRVLLLLPGALPAEVTIARFARGHSRRRAFLQKRKSAIAIQRTHRRRKAKGRRRMQSLSAWESQAMAAVNSFIRAFESGDQGAPPLCDQLV